MYYFCRFKFDIIGNVISIEIEAIKPKTRDWIIARASQEGVSPQRLLELVADQSAAKDGFESEIDIPLATAFKSGSEQSQGKEANDDR